MQRNHLTATNSSNVTLSSIFSIICVRYWKARVFLLDRQHGIVIVIVITITIARCDRRKADRWARSSCCSSRAPSSRYHCILHQRTCLYNDVFCFGVHDTIPWPRLQKKTTWGNYLILAHQMSNLKHVFVHDSRMCCCFDGHEIGRRSEMRKRRATTTRAALASTCWSSLGTMQRSSSSMSASFSRALDKKIDSDGFLAIFP